MGRNGEAGAKLGGDEQAQAAEHKALRPAVIHEIIREQGEEELRQPPSALALSAVAAGLSMGFSFLAMALLHAGLPEAPWRRLVSSFGYTIGFVIVVMGRQQLFTEKTLTAVLPVLTHRDGRSLMAMLRVWVIVLAGNTLASWAFAAVLMFPGLLDAEVSRALSEVSGEAPSGPFAATFLKAVFAGWIIALMVWLTPSARSAKLLVIVLMTYLVALGGFSHIIAGSAEVAYGVLQGEASMGEYWAGFYLPTLLGNVVGGVALAALLNHGPVADEVADEGG